MTESEYEVLRRKAREYKQMAELAIENDLDEQAVENYNFALEMLMKAVLVKEGCNPPKRMIWWSSQTQRTLETGGCCAGQYFCYNGQADVG